MNDETSKTRTSHGVGSSGPSAVAGGFLPGQVLMGRYRMVGLLGRGGMGEVYRADDLKLGQPVALKFLPREVEQDPQRLERFLTEVRLSLKVTHPNVCRVFDIGVLDDALPGGGKRHFLSMEYVDGEDLASLLRRIGRLPEDKATEIARQLCSGLAAAHGVGVLHRDLKPANVMIDGRGQAKITDFGLAGATIGISGAEARSGTPQYMAPEQFEGGALTEQTDLYSLGLVLYELFTGKRAFDSRDINELAALRTSTPTSPAAHVSGLDQAIERAILRCVDPDPARRPRSAALLAASLPGGDPLAMAVAAGETPSPDMVARAGGRGELKPIVATAYLVTILIGLVAVWIAEDRTALPNLVQTPKAPEELAVLSRSVIQAVGYTPLPATAVYGFQRDGQYFDKVVRENQSNNRWDDLRSVSPVPLWFWYRQAPAPMTPVRMAGAIDLVNPPIVEPGMIRVRLDPSGGLQELRVVPPDLPETPGPWAEPAWNDLLELAGQQPDEWQATEPLWAPPDASDARRAWIRGDLRIEAAAFRGKFVWFRVVPPWRKAIDAKPVARGAAVFIPSLASQFVMALIIVGGTILAYRNRRLGRSDYRGASRLAIVFVAMAVLQDVLTLSGDPLSWFPRVMVIIATSLLLGGIVWLCYAAIEPYVRRLWPNTLIAWSRALGGQWRDPLVGRHMLLGALAGLVFSTVFYVPFIFSEMVGVPPGAPDGPLEALTSVANRLSAIVGTLLDSVAIPVVSLVVILFLRVVLRRPWLAYAAAIAFPLLLQLGQRSWLGSAVALLVSALVLLLLTRLGLLAFVVAVAFSSWSPLVLTTDPSSWFFTASLVTMGMYVAVAVYAFIVSLGGQALFKDMT